MTDVIEYALRVCGDAACTATLQDYQAISATQITLPDLDDGHYFLDIVGYDQAHQLLARLPTPLSLTVDRTPPGAFSASSPTSHTNDPTPDVAWSASTEADHYLLTISASSDCTNPLQSYSSLTATSQATGPLDEGTHYACLAAVDAAGNTSLAAAHAFVVDLTPPGAFTVSGPATPGDDSSPEVSWSPASDAFSYVVEIATDSACASPMQSHTGVTATTLTLPILGEGSYFACVTALDQAGNPSSAAAYAFVVDATPPGSFSITAPAALASSSTPTVVWEGASGAAVYELAIGTDSACTNPLQTHSPLTGTSQPLAALVDGAYYACVTATDAAGNSTAAASHAFTIDTLAPNIDLGPTRHAGNSFTIRPSVIDASAMSFSWTQVSGPGTVTFGSANAKDTLLNANTEGSYQLRLTATDQAGHSTHADLTLTWDRSRLLALGRTDSCAIAAGGQLYCWGRNHQGQVGVGDQLMHPSPQPLSFGAERSALQVAEGADFTCVVLDDGALRCWGNNGSGSLGYNDITQRYTPPTQNVDLGAGRSVAQIATGFYHTCALLDDGNIKCWGYNASGQLGNGTTVDVWAPAATPIDLGAGLTAQAISLGEHFSCALLSDGTVSCWGENGSGQLGIAPGDTSDRSAPAAVALPGGLTAKKISAGRMHACAILSDDSVSCWGANTSGQLGDRSLTNRTTPVIVQGLAGTPAKIAAAATTSCVQNTAGAVSCVGSGTAALGAGRANFATDCSDGYSASQLACNANGGVWSSHFRDCTSGVSTGPSACTAAGGTWAHCSDFTKASSGTCGGTWDSTKYAYCTNTTGTVTATAYCTSTSGSMVSEGYCSDSSYSSKAACLGASKTWQIRRVLGPDLDFGAGNLVVALASSNMGSWSCAVLSDTNMSLKCWGDNTYGQLGYGHGTKEIAFHLLDLGAGATADKTVSASTSTCALLSDGTVKCWGDNSNGRLGGGNYTSLNTPPASAIALAASASDVTARTDYACALLSNGSVQCWGSNTYGRLGNGTVTESTSPVTVQNLGGSATGIGAGHELTCAIVGGDVKCWGNPSRLGIGYATAATSCSNGTSSSSSACSAASGTWSTELYNDCSNGISTSAAACTAVANGAWAHCSNGTSATSAACTTAGKTWDTSLYNYCTNASISKTASAFCTDNGGSFGNYGYCSNSAHPTRAACLNAAATWHVTTLPGANVDLGTAATNVAVSNTGACALLTGGSVRCWGDNTYGQAGVGSTATTNYTSAGAAVNFDGRTASKLVASKYSFCALLDDASLRCWGNNASGNLATGDTASLSQPAAVSADFGAGRSVVNVGQSCSGAEICIVADDGALICAGSLAPPFVSGDALTTPLELGTAAVPVAVTSGSAICVTFADGTVRCAGNNSNGEGGFGSTSYYEPPATANVLNLGL